MTDDPTRRPDEAPLEALLIELIDRFESGGAEAVEPLLAAHPQHGELLRRHLSRLVGLGLVDGERSPASTTGSFPERLGDFRLIERLGSGGMGVVFLAEQVSLGRRVALKLIRPEHSYFEGSRARFRREVEAIARLQHPGIVPVHATGEDAGVPWLAMDHVPGRSLDQVIQALAGRSPTQLRAEDLIPVLTADAAGSPTTPAPGDSSGVAFTGTWVTVCLRIARAVATALHHAHQRGVLHRDVKPSNIMLTPDGRPLLLDFGLARTDESARITQSGGALGSPAYMSPEQMRGDHANIDERTDVYSLGVTLIELLTLESPFAGDSAESTRQLVLAGVLPPLRTRNAAVPRDLETVCRKAIDLDRGRRYRDAAAFAEDLDNLLALRPIRAEPPGLFTIARRWTQRHPAQAIALVALFLLGFVAPTAFFLQQRAANERIRTALDRARVDRDRAREAVQAMLVRVANEQLLHVPKMQHLRRDLIASARAFHERFLLDGADDPELLEQAAASAHQLAILDAEFGQEDAALASAQRAVRLARDQLTRSDIPESHLKMSEALSLQARIELRLSRHADCDATLAEADGELRTLGTEGDFGTQVLIARMATARARALLWSRLDRMDDAWTAADEVLAIWRMLAPRVQGTDAWSEAFDQCLCTLADRTGLAADRERIAMAVHEADEVSAGIDPTILPPSSQHALARIEIARERITPDPAEQTALLQKAMALVRPSLELNPEDVNALQLEANALNSQALVAARAGRVDDAIAAFEQSNQRLRRMLAITPEHVEYRLRLANNLANLGAVLQDSGDSRSAADRFEEARDLNLALRALDPERPELIAQEHRLSWFLGQVYGDLGAHAEQAACAARLAELGADDPRSLRIAAGQTATAIRHLAADEAIAAADRAERRRELEQRALGWLREAARIGCTDHDWLRTSDEFAPLRSVEGFGEVLEAVRRNRADADQGR